MKSCLCSCRCGCGKVCGKPADGSTSVCEYHLMVLAARMEAERMREKVTETAHE